ncbi:collagen-like protein [Arenibacter sp. S6351L]|uniref:collagen-like protein n=1 Tax=Arenibacter sp. S6351L TaxID=2926407 RepID=UPI001FF18EA0|nr:collagen-like protein [Arenibacter sp. S6351L]MCK0136572.1 collagen-like protein [Arenibacter sp. S6351L]
MKTSKKFLGLVIAVMALTFTSCSKDGEIGPIGPTGPRGEQGIQGATGANGEVGEDGEDGQDGIDGVDGQDGNANIIASEWISSQFPEGTAFTYFLVDDDRITNELVAEAAILAYGLDTTGAVAPLPVSSNNESYSYVLYPQFLQIGFFAKSVDGTNETFDILSAFRYVIIPTTMTGKTSGTNIHSILKNAGIDINDYYAVMDYLGLDY